MTAVNDTWLVGIFYTNISCDLKQRDFGFSWIRLFNNKVVFITFIRYETSTSTCARFY